MRAVSSAGGGEPAMAGCLSACRPAAGRWSRALSAGGGGRVRGGYQDVSTPTALGRSLGTSPRRKRSTMSMRPPQHGQAGGQRSRRLAERTGKPLGDLLERKPHSATDAHDVLVQDVGHVARNVRG